MAEDKPTLIDETPEADPVQEAPKKEEQYIQILPGDTLESFAQKHGTTPEAILERNKLHPTDFRFGYWVFV